MKNVFLLLLLLGFIPNSYAKLVKYNFDINFKEVNFTGKPVTAMAIANQIPGPTISAKVGDTLQVTFNNKMDVDTSIHWHGVLLPNDQDGVPYLTTQPIKAHSSFTYSYKVTHHGTYWYHSHTGLQEQRGVYGSIVFHPKTKERVPANRDHVVVLSDWTNENPKRVLANLKKEGHYYSLKKDSVQSWDQVLRYGLQSIKNRLIGSLSRMGPMDISDVGYDAYLTNGKITDRLKARAGEKVRIRLINAAASSYFNVEFANSPMTIVAADGVDIKPIKVKRLRIAIAETYDVIVSIPKNKTYEFRATSEDGTGHTSVFIGSMSKNAKKVFAPDIPKPNLFLMGHDHGSHYMHGMHKKMGHSKHNKHGKHSKHKMKHSHHKMNHSKKNKHHHMNHNRQPQSKTASGTKKTVIKYMTDYENLKAVKITAFPKKQTRRTVTLNLTGNMERYVWSFNNKTLSEADQILIKKGEVVRFVLQNRTMMHHPIHLHGHFFRVLNKHKSRSPLKHTVNVPPMETVTIEFDANAEKDWMFHCHNLYHMKTGMTRIISYKNTTTATKEILSKLSRQHVYFHTDVSLMSNMSLGMFKASTAKNILEMDYESGYKKQDHYDVEVAFLRNLTRFLDVYIGAEMEGHIGEEPESIALFGVRYMLPMLIEADLRIDSNKKFKLELGSHLQLTKRINLDWHADTDKDYNFHLSYEMNKKFLLTGTYDSHLKWGAGIRIKL